MKLPNYDFKTLWSLAPDEEYSSVKIFNKMTNNHEDKVIYRRYMSYLNTPDFNQYIKKSYMHTNKMENNPIEFESFIDFVKKIDDRYNQLTVNWYKPDDYIEQHSDCSAYFIDENAPILTINLVEFPDNKRILRFQNKTTNEITEEKLENDCIKIITNNKTHRHSVTTGESRRISLTFRMMKPKQ